jgi:hypothetical protein
MQLLIRLAGQKNIKDCQRLQQGYIAETFASRLSGSNSTFRQLAIAEGLHRFVAWYEKCQGK